MAGSTASEVRDTVAEGAWRQRLANAGAELGLLLTDADVDRLLAYLALRRRWNRVYNLTALRDPAQMFSHHLVDCLAVLPALRRHANRRDLRVLDVGSGGGLPGVVLAILQPAWQVTCVDSVAKKVAFIQHVRAELSLANLHPAHSRVEAMPANAAFDLITSRAFASLADFVKLTSGSLAVGGLWAAMKGRPSAEELAALPPYVDMFHVEQLLVPGLDAQRCLIWIRPVRA